MSLAKYDEDNFNCYVERLSSKGLNMSREWTCPAIVPDRRSEKEDAHEKRQ